MGSGKYYSLDAALNGQKNNKKPKTNNNKMATIYWPIIMYIAKVIGSDTYSTLHTVTTWSAAPLSRIEVIVLSLIHI